jgi:hypothetical protein
MRRWLARRIENDDVLRAVEEHTLVYPIEHGARVRLPEIDEDQLGLFEWSGERDRRTGEAEEADRMATGE